MNIPITRTSLTEAEIQIVTSTLRSGWLVQGPKVREFEEKWAVFTGAKDAIAVTSCTSGLHLSLAALDFSHGDEAIVPAFTWISTANVVEHLGGKVVFCDIDLDTFNIDVACVNPLITTRTKAILPVHLFGLAADMTTLSILAKQNDLLLLEDAACGFGSRFHGKHVGTLGNAGCFSFHPRKAITTGEGGIISTNDSALAEKLRRLRDHGAVISDLQRHIGAKPYLLSDHPNAGYNQRMTDFQAALGSAQMDRASEIIRERQRLAARYDQAFYDLEWLQTPANPESHEHGYQSYACLYMPNEAKEAASTVNVEQIKAINIRRNAWMDKLQQLGISTRPATHAVHMLDFYKRKYGLKPEDFPNAFAASDCSISFPLFHGMTQDEQDYVIATVRSEKF